MKAEAFRVYPARWREVLRELGGINDRFSVSVRLYGSCWVIERGPNRWSFAEERFLLSRDMGADFFAENLDHALQVAADLCEKTTNILGETFAQVAGRLLDGPGPD